jgi:hypothetical protein
MQATPPPQVHTCQRLLISFMQLQSTPPSVAVTDRRHIYICPRDDLSATVLDHNPHCTQPGRKKPYPSRTRCCLIKKHMRKLRPLRAKLRPLQMHRPGVNGTPGSCILRSISTSHATPTRLTSHVGGLTQNGRLYRRALAGNRRNCRGCFCRPLCHWGFCQQKCLQFLQDSGQVCAIRICDGTHDSALERTHDNACEDVA